MTTVNSKSEHKLQSWRFEPINKTSSWEILIKKAFRIQDPCLTLGSCDSVHKRILIIFYIIHPSAHYSPSLLHTFLYHQLNRYDHGYSSSVRNKTFSSALFKVLLIILSPAGLLIHTTKSRRCLWPTWTGSSASLRYTHTHTLDWFGSLSSSVCYL